MHDKRILLLSDKKKEGAACCLCFAQAKAIARVHKESRNLKRLASTFCLKMPMSKQKMRMA